MKNRELTVDEKVAGILSVIEEEKRQQKPDRKLMRSLFNQIVKIKEDYRETYTGQDNKYQLHTSMRGWSDDV